MILFYTAGAWIIKLSSCVTLYRIAPRKAMRVTIALLAVATTTITIFEFFWTPVPLVVRSQALGRTRC